jgi:hypothetical protein
MPVLTLARKGAKEIVLKDDDPEALEFMLQFAYDENETPTKDDPIESIYFLIKVYEVADKYQYPQLQEETAWRLRCGLSAHLTEIDITAENIHEVFCNIVERIYSLARACGIKHELIKALLRAVLNNPRVTPMANHGRMQEVVTKTAEQVPEFGRDMFLTMMKEIQTSESGELREIDSTVKAKCPRCESTWMLPQRHLKGGKQDEDGHGFCWKCGAEVEDWRNYEF